MRLYTRLFDNPGRCEVCGRPGTYFRTAGGLVRACGPVHARAADERLPAAPNPDPRAAQAAPAR